MSEYCRTIQSSRDLGAFIYDARTQRNLTQETLATKANVSRSWLIGLEQGKRPRAEMDKILSLLNALDVSLSLHMLDMQYSTQENSDSPENLASTRTPQASPQSPQKTESVSWNSSISETVKNTATPQLDVSQYFGTYLPDQSVRSLGNISQIAGDALKASIPNFGQASGISQALNRKEQKNKTTDSE